MYEMTNERTSECTNPNPNTHGTVWVLRRLNYLTRRDTEITSRLVKYIPTYDFHSRAVKNRKPTSERSERVSLRFYTNIHSFNNNLP